MEENWYSIHSFSIKPKLTSGPYFSNVSFSNGPKKPDDIPIKFIIEYKVPAKFGPRSWQFCKLVRVAAPLKPSEAVKIDMTKKVSFMYGIANNKAPGMM